MNIKLFCFIAMVALIGSGVEAACGSTLSTYLTQSDVNTTLEYLYVHSPYSVTIVSGDEFAIIWNGTDAGEVDNLVMTDQMANVTLVDSTVKAPATSPTRPPVIKVSHADRTKSALSICSIVLGLSSLFCLRKGISSTIFASLFVLSMASLISSSMFSDSPCPGATVTLQIPESTVRFICANDAPCVCGPGYAGDNCEGASVPVATPISTPIAAPVASPVNPPTNPPVNPPTSSPMTPIAPPVAPTCSDNQQNGGETDVDCGGGTCNKCAATKKCSIANDCTTGVCTTDVCQQPSCNDAVMNGAETDVDCGGGTCSKCAATKKCSIANDCTSGVCTSNICQQPSCNDAVMNGAETDKDCGGGTCTKCAATKMCSVADDCTTGVCTSNICQQSACNDGVQNGAETDVDCGGGTCSKCATAKKCSVANDCSSGVCTGNTCQQPACDDNVLNGVESDIDCGGGQCDECGGGSCAKCDNGKACTAASDCASGNCKNLFCSEPDPCSNGSQDNGETDTDCGGANCPKCSDGKICVQDDDCTSGRCFLGDVDFICTPAQCFDGVKNGVESDIDCGGNGNLCPRCGLGQKCNSASDCDQIVFPYLCVGTPRTCNTE